MVSVGRVACVGLPFLLSLASLVCLVLVYTGDMSNDSRYFIKADTTNFSVNRLIQIDDWYTIGLWDYCSGNNDGTHIYCSPKTAGFWFNPVTVWDLGGTAADDLISAGWGHDLDVYRDVSKWMFAAYTIAIASNALVMLFSIWAFFSRLGSFFATGFAGLATIFTLASAITAEALFNVVKKVLDDHLGKYGASFHLSGANFIISWVAAAFALGAGFFWTFSICCCGPHSRRNNSKPRNNSWRSENYQRVPSPFAGEQQHQAQGKSVPLQGWSDSRETAYEPYRQHV